MEDNKKQIIDQACSLIRSGDTVTFKQLLTQHPNLTEMQVYEGTVISQSLLHYAASENNGEMCSYLVDKGICINSTNYSYLTPLEYFASNGNYELAREFISKGAWVDGDSRGISTPLISAAREGHFDIVEYLIQCGADINRLQPKSNCTALDIAKTYGHEKVIDVLKAHDAMKAHENFDLAVERASGVICKVHNDAGWVLSYKLNKNSIDIRTALLKDDNKNKLLFTVGAFEKKPRIELMLCVPVDWSINQQLSNENSIASFPVQFLFSLAEYRLSGGELDEGCVFEKQESFWNHLVWPEKIDGFGAVDYAFGSELDQIGPNEETVKLLLLVPMKNTKSGCPKGVKLEEWIEKRKKAKWAGNALKYDHLNDMKRY